MIAYKVIIVWEFYYLKNNLLAPVEHLQADIILLRVDSIVNYRNLTNRASADILSHNFNGMSYLKALP